MKKRVWLVILVIAAVAVVAASAYFYRQSKLPMRYGTLLLPNIEGQARVAFDTWGIPHIDAQSDTDGFQVLGFVHAQDRLWQMDLLRRLGSGRLAELFGQPAVELDKLARVFGMTEFAEQQANYTQKHRPDIVARIDAYYQGVNQAIAQRPVPIEYDILGVTPEPFEHKDVYAIMSYIAYSFTSGARTDLLMQTLKQSLPPALFAELRPGSPLIPEGSLSQEYYQQHEFSNIRFDLGKADKLLEQLDRFGHFDGSNAWVISAQKSATGKPLLANDPHMQMSTPAVWYETQLMTPNINVYGHFLPGIPFPLLTRTERHVYGLTMLLNDNVDFYVLTDQTDNVADTLRVREEVITVKGEDAISMEVKVSPAGPIVNDLFELENKEQVAMGWTFTQTQNHVAETLHDIAYATNHQQMKAAIDKHWGPGINVLYADIDNNIAHWSAGRYRKHEDYNGKVFHPIKGDIALAQQFHDADYNPVRFNPKNGVSFSVNHPLLLDDGTVADGYYPPLSRVERASELFFGQERFSVEDMKAFQTDSFSYRATNLRDTGLSALSALKDADPTISNIVTILQDWNGYYDSSQIAPVIIERYGATLIEAIFADEMQQHFESFAHNGSLADKSLDGILLNNTSAWWDDIRTPERETAEDTKKQAWQTAIASLQDTFGPDPNAWQWGKTATILHPHAMNTVPILGALLSVGPMPLESGTRTLNNMLYSNTPIHIVNSYGPSARRIIDLSAIQKGLNVTPVGQSGIVFDQHYDDQFELYMRNEYRPADMWSQQQIKSSKNALVVTSH